MEDSVFYYRPEKPPFQKLQEKQADEYAEAMQAIVSEYIQTFPDSPPGNLLREPLE
jgi:hypothetical protein